VNGQLTGGLELDFVDKKTPPVVGDVIVTSGLGGVYPKGIVIGEVTGVSAISSDLYAVVTLASRVDIDRIEEVLVLQTEMGAATLPGGGE
jgi:rod shape-determining protein MreC